MSLLLDANYFVESGESSQLGCTSNFQELGHHPRNHAILPVSPCNTTSVFPLSPCTSHDARSTYVKSRELVEYGYSGYTLKLHSFYSIPPRKECIYSSKQPTTVVCPQNASPFRNFRSRADLWSINYKPSPQSSEGRLVS